MMKNVAIVFASAATLAGVGPRFGGADVLSSFVAGASSQEAHSVDKCHPSNAHCVPVIAFTSTRDGNGEGKGSSSTATGRFPASPRTSRTCSS
jgi:hypothetical protein